MLVYGIDYTKGGVHYDEVKRTVSSGNYNHNTVLKEKSITVFMDFVFAVNAIRAAAKRNNVYDDIHIVVSYDYDLINTNEIINFFDFHKEDFKNIYIDFLPEVRTMTRGSVNIPSWINALRICEGISFKDEEAIDRFGTELIQASSRMIVKNCYFLSDKYYDGLCILDVEINGTQLLLNAKVDYSHFDYYFRLTGTDQYQLNRTSSENIRYGVEDAVKRVLSYCLDFAYDDIVIEKKVIEAINKKRREIGR